MRLSVRPHVTTLAGVLFLSASPLEGQVLVGRLLEQGSETPVPQAVVQLMADEVTEVTRTVTADDGSFEMRAPRAGDYFIVASALGYEHAVTAVFELQLPGRRVRVLISPEPIPLEAVTGTAAAIRPYSRNQQFYDRMRQRSAGRFITREQIERRNPTFAHDMLRNIPGLRVAIVNGQALIEAAQPTSLRTFTHGARCLANMYIDGMPVANASINSITPGEIEGFEVYSNTAAIPAEFNSSVGAACGVVVIWTRGGFEPRR